MRILCYEDWYNKTGNQLEKYYEEWLEEAPEGVYVEELPEVQEYLEDMYESYVSEFEDRAYDEYRDSLLMED